MATQPRSITWQELRIGILVITGFSLLALSIFYITGASGLFEPSYTIVGYFATANGLRNGAEVWLEGVQAGNVASVSVMNQSNDPNKNVAVSMDIYKKYQDLIRTDSKVQIQTQGPLGNNIVGISRGTPAGEVIPDGGSVQGEGAVDIKRIIGGTNDFVANLDYLSDKYKEFSDRISRGEGTIGKLKTDRQIHASLDKTLTEGADLAHDVRAGTGTIGLNTQAPLAAKVDRVVDRFNNMADYVQSGQGTLGQIPSLATRADALATHFQDIARNLDRGSLRKLINSPDLLQPTVQKFDELTSAVQNGAGARFLKDPTFHASINQISSEISKLIYDFSKNPSAYLNIRLRPF